MALSCVEFLRRLDADDALESGEMREHAAACAACRDALTRWRAVAREMRGWGEELAPPFLHTRIMAELRAQRATDGELRAWWLRRWPLWAYSGVAVALVAVAVGVSLRHASELATAPQELRAMAEAEPRRLEAAAPTASLSATEVEHRGQKEKRYAYADRQQPGREPEAKQAPASPAAKAPAPASHAKAETEALATLREERVARDEGPRRAAARPVPAVPPAEARLERERMKDGVADSIEQGEEARVGKSQTLGGASPAPAPALQPRARAAQATPTHVRCRLVPLAGGPVRSVEVSPVLLRDGTRVIDVDAGGAVRLLDDEETSRVPARGVPAEERRERARGFGIMSSPALGRQDRDALEALGLAPGRYRLERLDE